jgi:hypothetical protein
MVDDDDEDEDIETQTSSGDLVMEKPKKKRSVKPKSLLPIRVMIKLWQQTLSLTKFDNTASVSLQSDRLNLLSKFYFLAGSLSLTPHSSPALPLVDKGKYQLILHSLTWYREERDMITLGLFAIFNLG